MDNEVIDLLYNRFKELGYKDSREDYISLLNSDQEVFNDAYSYFKSSGYEDTDQDFKGVLGIGSAPVDDLKKKEVASTASPTEGTPLASPSQPTAPIIQGSPGLTAPLAASQASFGQPSETAQPEATPIQKEELKKPVDLGFIKPLTDQITPDLIGHTEEFVVPKMNYEYGDLGFKFEESGATGDWMTVKSPDGKKEIEISLDPITDSKKQSEATRLKQFIEQNSAEVSNLEKIQEEYYSQGKKIKDQKEFDSVVKSASKKANTLQSDMASFVKEHSETTKEFEELSSASDEEKATADWQDRYNIFQEKKLALEEKKKNIISREGNIDSENKALQRNLGKYIEMKSEQGTFGGALRNWLSHGLGSIGAGTEDLLINIEGSILPRHMVSNSSKEFEEEALKIAKEKNIEPPQEGESFQEWITSEGNQDIEDEVRDRWKKKTKKDIIPDVRKGLDTVLGTKDTTTEWSDLKRKNFWIGAIAGTIESAPAMALAAVPIVGTALSTAAFYAQTTDALMEEIDNDPDTKNLSENEKQKIIAPIAIGSAVLEEFGLRNVIASKGLLNGLVLKAIGKASATTTAKTFEELVRNEIKGGLAKGLLTLTAGGLAEAETGGAQQVLEFGVKQIYNEVEGKEMFKKNPKAFTAEWVKQVAIAAGQEAVGGFMLGTPNAISAAYTKKNYLNINDETFKIFSQMANDEGFKNSFVTKLKNDVNSGKVTAKQANEILNNYDSSVGLFRSVPQELNLEGQKEAMNLLVEKQRLEEQMEGKDPALVKKQKERISKINDELDNITQQKTPEYTVNDRVTSRETLIKKINALTADNIGKFNILVKNDPELETLLKEKTDAIQKPSTNESLLGSEQSQMGLQEVGEGNTQPQGTTQGTQNEVSNEKPQVLSTPEATTTALEALPKKGKQNVTFTNEDGNQVSLNGNEKALADLYHEAVNTPEEDRTPAQNSAIDAIDLGLGKVIEEQTAQQVSSKTQTTTPPQQPSLHIFRQSVSTSNDQEVNNLIKNTTNKVRLKTIGTAQKAVKTLKSVLPNFDIVLHDNDQSFSTAVSKLGGDEKSTALFSYWKNSDNTWGGAIHINLNDSKGSISIAHEVAHAVMLHAFGENANVFKDFRTKISKVLSESTNKELTDFANKYIDKETGQLSEENHEEYLVELIARLTNQEGKIESTVYYKIATAINDLVSKLTNGAIKPFEDIKDTKQLIDFLNKVSNSIKVGEAINPSDLAAIKEGASVPIGSPSVITKSRIGESIDFPKTPYELSFVTESDKINISDLIKDIVSKNQKVWFWMADQLGRGDYHDTVIGSDHYLDAGPGFALDPKNRSKKVLWASGVSKKELNNKIKDSDYIFFISGSPEKAKLFNKRVLKLIGERIDKTSNFEKFKEAINNFGIETNDLKTIKNALSNVKSFDELAESSKRKPFLIAIDNVSKNKTTPKGSLKELLGSFNAFVDYNKLRDGFYRENNFTQNDIMLVGKPISVGGKAVHSTYENEILGDVVGVPDSKVNAWEIMPDAIKSQYKNILSTPQKTKVIAAESGKIHEIKIKYRKGLIDLTENDVLKYKKIGIEDERTAQAINQIGLSEVKFTKPEIEKKIKLEFDKLIDEHKSYVLSQDSPAITNAIKAEINTLEDNGAPISQVERAREALNENSSQRKAFIKEYSDAQLKTLDQWTKYLSQSDYDNAFKYLILDAVLTHNYDAKTEEFTKRNDKTLRNFTPFDAGTLASIYNTSSKSLLKDYIKAQDKNIDNIVEANTISTTKEGKWLKFDGGPNAKDVQDSANKLSQLVQNTYWCTKTNALSQLKGGDFYVYVTENDKGDQSARIAVRMDGDKVGEVRGNASSAQDIEPDMLPIAHKFIKEEIPNNSGEKWLNSIAYNTKVKEFINKILDIPFAMNHIIEYMDIIKDEKKFSTDYGENGLVSKLKKIILDKYEKKEFANELKGKVAAFVDSENFDPNTVFVLGNINFYRTDDVNKSFGDIRYVGGNIQVVSSSIETLGKIEIIGGDLNINYSRITSLGKLKSIGGYFDLNYDLKSLGELEIIGGTVNFSDSYIVSLDKLKQIGGNAYFSNSKVQSLGELKLVNGSIDLSNSKIISLGNLEIVGKDIEFDNTPRITSLGKLKSIGGKIIGNEELASQYREIKTKSRLSETNPEGYKRVMDKVDQLIARQTKAKIATEKMAKNIDLLLRKMPEYINAKDSDKKILERDARAKVGAELGRAPSRGRILGIISNLTSISDKEKLSLITKIRSLVKDAGKDLVNELRELNKKGRITSAQAVNLISRFNKVNMLNEVSVSRFVDYMANVFNNADYANTIQIARNTLSTARKNVQTKIGVSENLSPVLMKLFTMDPSLVPTSMLEKYMELVDMFGKKQTVLTLQDKALVTKNANEIMDQIENEQSQLDELAQIFDSSKFKVLNDDGSISYSKSIDNMLKNGEIDEYFADIMRKYKTGIVGDKLSAKMTEEEIADEKENLLDAIDSSPIQFSAFPTQDERNLIADLKELIKVTDLSRLSNLEIKNLLKLIDNINNSYLPHYAFLVKTKLDSINAQEQEEEAVSKAKPLTLESLFAKIRSIFGKDYYDALFTNNANRVIDQVLGDGKAKKIFNAIFKPSSEALARFNTDVQRIQDTLRNVEQKIAKSFKLNKLNPDKTTMSKYKIMTYLLQLEYQSNEGSKQVNSAAKFLEKTILHISQNTSRYNEKDAQMLRSIASTEGYLNSDGEIDLDKLYASFNPAEKAAIKTIREINEEIKDKAVYTAQVIRGDKINLINNYVHLNVLHETEAADMQEGTDFINNFNESLRPSTRAKSLIERTGAVSAISFDPFTATQRGSKQVLMDYHLTGPIKTARMAMALQKKELQNRIDQSRLGVKGDKTNEKVKTEIAISNAIEKAFENSVLEVLGNSFSKNDITDSVIDFIATQGYRATLASIPRAAAELSSNLAYAFTVDPEAMVSGMKNRALFMGEEGSQFMYNVKSAETGRVLAGEGLSGKFVDTNILKSTSGIKGSAASRNAITNKMTQIHNLTSKKLFNSVAFIADALVSSPDKMVTRPLWFGSFINEFERLTGEKPNTKKIAANDEAYMNKFKSEIEQAKNIADDTSVRASSTTNPFVGVAKKNIVTKPGMVGGVKSLYHMFNNFLVTFTLYEYMTARTGIMAMMNNGSVSRGKGARMIAGVTMRSMIYFTLGKYLSNQFTSLLTGGADDDKDKDEKSLDKKAEQSLVSALSNLLLGRNFGNLARTIVSTGLETINEKYLDFLREGDYDKYKDAIAYTPVPVTKTGKEPDYGEFLIKFAGPFTPLLATLGLGFKRAFENEKVKADAIERSERDVWQRIPFELLGELGMIPFFKDIKKAVVSDINARQPLTDEQLMQSFKKENEKNLEIKVIQQLIRNESNIKIKRELRSSLLDLTITPEEKKAQSREENAIREENRAKLQSMLGKWNSISEMRDYSPNEYEAKFGPKTTYGKEHAIELAAHSLISKALREAKDRKYNKVRQSR